MVRGVIVVHVGLAGGVHHQQHFINIVAIDEPALGIAGVVLFAEHLPVGIVVLILSKNEIKSDTRNGYI